MIRINLLPFRAARKRENVRRQVSISGLLLVLFILLLVGGSIHYINKASDLKATEQSKNVELQGYQKELDEIASLEKKIKEMNTKLDVIKELEKAKTGPVLLLSAIADAIPKDKVYLISFNETNGKLTLTGIAMDNPTVSVFMKNLEAAKDVIKSVDIKSSTLREIQTYKVYNFVLDCRTYAYKEVQATTKKGK